MVNKTINKTDETPSVIKLFGSEEENFYQLGQKERSFFRENKSSIYRLFGISQERVHTLAEKFIRTLSIGLAKQHPKYIRDIEAYAEGLHVSPNEVFSLFLIPEVLSAIHKFIPGVAGNIFGCSSIFGLNENGIIHGRTLDFPLIGVLDKGMTNIQFQFKEQKVFYHSFKGIPFPALTAMNENGVTLGLHQKFNRYFNPKGTPIFEIGKLVISQARDIKDVFEILDHSPSLTSWALNIGFGNKAYEIDLKGNNYSVIETEIFKNDWIYNCNEPIEKENSDFINVVPFGMEEFNLFRRQQAERSLNKSKKIDAKNILKVLSQKNTAIDKNVLSPLTMASLDIVAMEPCQNRSFRFFGDGPQNWNNDLFEFNDVFNSPKINKVKKTQSQKNENFYKALKEFAKASTSFQENNFESLFHHLQIAELYLRNDPYLDYLRFFKLAYSYVLLDQSNLPDIYLDFLNLHGKLSPYLEDHIELYLCRLETILEYPKGQRNHSFYNKNLEKIGELERKLGKRFLLNKRRFYLPRPEVHDIIYPFFG